MNTDVKLALLVAALEIIESLDPELDSDEMSLNEWGEAQCFVKAKTIAREALESIA